MRAQVEAQGGEFAGEGMEGSGRGGRREADEGGARVGKGQGEGEAKKGHGGGVQGGQGGGRGRDEEVLVLV